MKESRGIHKVTVPGIPRFIAPEGEEPKGLVVWFPEVPQAGSAVAGQPPPPPPWFQDGVQTGALLDQLAGLELGKDGLFRPFTSEKIPLDLGRAVGGIADAPEKNWGWELDSVGPGPGEIKS